MKPFVLLLALPLCLSAQVEVDTVINLGHNLYNGHYIPELNKLYVMAPYYVIAVDCSTWQKTAEFPTDAPYGGCRFAWNPSRNKLYVALKYNGINSLDSTLVIDVTADTAWWIALRYDDLAYSASWDRLYGMQRYRDAPVRVLDCATDSLVDSMAMPIAGYGARTLALDSVNGRVYVSIGAWGRTPHMAVYDVPSDSLLALREESCTPGEPSFHFVRNKAYVVPNDNFPGLARAGVFDKDTLGKIKHFPIKALSFCVANNGHGSVAVNSLMDKVYFGGNRGPGVLPVICTLFVVDCATDSVIKGIEFRGRGADGFVVWVPWSNRVYYDADERFHMAVLDCENDSVIIPELVLPGQYWAPADLLLDPVRERIFAIGADTTAVHVLRDVQQGVAEPGVFARAPRNAWTGPSVVRGLLWLGPVLGHDPKSQSGFRSCPASLLDIAGQKVMELAPGPNDVRNLSPGVYFIQRNAESGRRPAVTKVLLAN